MSKLETVIALLKSRRQEIHPERARFILALTRLLAEGKPVSAQRLADILDEPVEFVQTTCHQMREGGMEFNENGELIGAALTLTPTRHQFVVDSVSLYAWCALDTLFLPAYIGKSAQVTSTCPQTDEVISITVTPHTIAILTPASTVLSIVTATDCTSGIDGTFCSQIHFFASHDAAEKWIGERPNFAILTIAEACQLADEVYIEPMLKHI